MCEIIPLFKQRTIEDIKEELEVTIQDIGIDNELLKNKFVIFNTENYNNTNLINHSEVLKKVKKMLEASSELLELIQHYEKQEEIQNVINLINNEV